MLPSCVLYVHFMYMIKEPGKGVLKPKKVAHVADVSLQDVPYIRR